MRDLVGESPIREALPAAAPARAVRSAAAALIMGCMVACGTGTAAPPATAAVPAGRALRPVSAPALQALVTDLAHELLIPGALVLLRTPQGEFTVSYGTTQLGSAVPPASGTYFRIASNTKTMTAAVVLQLAQEGKLALTDPISKYISGVPDGEHISIAELLEMRSGLYNYTAAPALSASIDRDPTRAWTAQELLAIAFAHPPGARPGSTYEYCNTNYLLLGLLIEKLDGRPLARSMQERLFTPLGLVHTLLPAGDVSTLPLPYSHGYLYGSSSEALVGEPPYDAALQSAARAGKVLPKDYTEVNHSFAWAAGAAISTAGELATWTEALVTGRLLDGIYQRRWLESLRPTEPAAPAGQQYGYGIGQLRWAGNAMYFHGGETAGYNSFMGYDPVNKVTLVIWTNLAVALDGKPTANTLMLKVLDHVYAASPLQPQGASAAGR